MKKEVNEKYLKEIYLNVLKAIIIILYFFVLNLSYENVSIEHLEIGIKIFTIIFLFISIYIFERAYKKDDDNLAIQGIEILVLATYTLTTDYITKKFNFNFKSYSLVAAYILAIYFILKCIIIYTKGRKEISDELSDIKEIVKKSEPIKKEATKKKKDPELQEKLDKTTEDKTVKKETEKEAKNKDDKEIKTSRNKKVKNQNTDIKDEKNNKTNKQQKAKKVTKTKTTSKSKTSTKRTTTVKKEVKEND